MIYFLSGLLIIHGIICLIGAFIPVYPPVFFFFAFFPGHFAIRLIIVLLVVAAQFTYGTYLALGKKLRIKWYWPAIATIIIAGLLLVYPSVQSPGLFGASTEKGENRQPIPVEEMYPSPTGPEAPDDIVPTPGGGTYRANLHQQGVENPWPPIESADVVLGGGLDTLNVSYRDYIESEAGETRNNIVRIRKEGGLFNRNLDFYSVNVPTGITLTDGGRGIGLPGTLGAVLAIEIAPDVQPGLHSFGIGIEVDGRDYGTVPCTIEVSAVNKITIQPEPGSYLGTPDDKLSEIVLKDAQIRKESCDKDYFSPWFPSVKKGEPCLAVSGQIQNRDKEKFHIGMTALGYDAAGEVVAGTLDAAHISGAIGLYLEYEETGEFMMHLSFSDNISTIRIFAQSALDPLP